MTVTNTGSVAIKFTGCIFMYKLSTSTTYLKGTCKFSAPITVPAHFVGKLMWFTYAPFGTHAGTYNAKVTWVNSVDKSGTGTFNYIVP